MQQHLLQNKMMAAWFDISIPCFRRKKKKKNDRSKWKVFMAETLFERVTRATVITDVPCWHLKLLFFMFCLRACILICGENRDRRIHRDLDLISLLPTKCQRSGGERWEFMHFSCIPPNGRRSSVVGESGELHCWSTEMLWLILNIARLTSVTWSNRMKPCNCKIKSNFQTSAMNCDALSCALTVNLLLSTHRFLPLNEFLRRGKKW